MSKQSLAEFFEQKRVRLALAVICTYLAINSIAHLVTGETEAEWLRGGGGILIWGGWAVVNALKPYGRQVSGINTAVNIGFVLVVASWFFR